MTLINSLLHLNKQTNKVMIDLLKNWVIKKSKLVNEKPIKMAVQYVYSDELGGWFKMYLN